MNKTNKLNPKEIIFITFSILIFIFTIISFSISIYSIKQTQKTQQSIDNISYQIYRDNNILQRDATKKELIDEINNYINKVAPTSIVDGNHLFNLCEKYNVNIIFALAQGQKESHFATRGLGGKINNIFNVQVYDSCKKSSDVNRKMRKKHPNESIEPYLQLLDNDYLVNGKTEQDLLKNYVNKKGQRYATHKTYEQDLIEIINIIKQTTKIDSLYKEYENYQILSNY